MGELLKSTPEAPTVHYTVVTCIPLLGHTRAYRILYAISTD
jgi:hypothetical protein